MTETVQMPDPEKKINVLKRYLHILALLQNSEKDPQDLNGSTLADILSLDEDFKKPLTDKNIRDYIQKNLKDELGINIDVHKGERRIRLSTFLEGEVLERVAGVYASFVIEDSTRNVILKNFIKNHPYDCLWVMARIYFASLERRKVSFDYRADKDRIITNIAHPYHLVFRNNNLYLVCWVTATQRMYPLIVSHIDNLKVLDEYFTEDPPSVDVIFSDSLGSFIGKTYNVKICFTEKVHPRIEQILSILEPDIIETDGGKNYEASFTVSDDYYLCKQLFLYGKEVEIVEPPEIRELMITMLEESLGVYRRGIIANWFILCICKLLYMFDGFCRMSRTR